jgi:hypothetical protein
MQVGVVRSELAARASGCGFGEPPKPNGQRLVSAFGLVPSQLRIGGAALGGKGVRITNPRHGWLPACAAKNSPSHGLLCPQRPVARLWGAGHTAWSCEIEGGQNGFGEPPKPTGQRPVLPMTAAAQGEAGAVWGLLVRLGLSLCGRFGFPAFCAFGFVSDFGLGALSFAGRHHGTVLPKRGTSGQPQRRQDRRGARLGDRAACLACVQFDWLDAQPGCAGSLERFEPF